MAAVELQRLPTRFVPESGRIVGGRLAGWSFGDTVLDVERGREVVRARVTPPTWPFPLLKPVTLGPTDFRGFKPSTNLTSSIDVERRIKAIQEASK